MMLVSVFNSIFALLCLSVVLSFPLVVSQAIQRSEEAEAAKVQLEQDIYDTRQELEQLQEEHVKVKTTPGKYS